ncbi:PQQ-dependent sugar dehydrogenase [Actinopolymorpha singaporensis]|uniref:Glucose/arabinose dehydrogenase, beta-propeller fold n=1 Tax=Actinopolymorpha singaporensis TaxID=117157 RepID=A0A1H1SE48_9ACTN|nr:PQQ-dependent sugar dehydrogenase [Actinopolymorpha singaporensis]SDS46257.1 Glucose/arabinose dehydrogenase, beta-propeller fold [Actinopolymorpha singaporensis]
MLAARRRHVGSTTGTVGTRRTGSARRTRGTWPHAVTAVTGVVLLAGLVTACAVLPVAAPSHRPSPSPTPVVLNGPKPTSFAFLRAPRNAVRGDGLIASQRTLVTHLDVPWGVAFLPDGSALVTERAKRRILRVGPRRTASGELTVTPLTSVEGVYSNNEGGLLGIAASPRFARDKTVFVYYTTKVDNRIARMRLVGPRPRPEAIVTGIPLAGVHNGGRLAFGPDGYLYASTGDASRAGASQDVRNLGGKILRMTTDGKPPPGNPFPGSLVWSYGHRNPEGMAWDASGRMYVAEIGEAMWDELNLVLPGRNYGWPKVQGMGRMAGMTNPVAVWRPEVGVTDGIAIIGHAAIITCLRGQRIYLVDLGRPIDFASTRIVGTGTGEASIRWRPAAGVLGRPLAALVGKYGRLRAAVVAPDGSVWLTTSNRDGRNQPVAEDDRIIRLTLRPAAMPGATGGSGVTPGPTAGPTRGPARSPLPSPMHSPMPSPMQSPTVR